MEFKDHFSVQSETYAKSRPHYPDELFQFLASLVPTHNLAWDCATGNGQAAVSLAKYFERVIATDGSEQQLKNAVPNDKITYYKALADNSGIGADTVDLVTIAAALHWMDFDKFYKEVNRVLKPGGIFAGWTYCDCHISEAIDPILYHFSRVTLADYWPPERVYVSNYYRDIPVPFTPIDAPSFQTLVDATPEFLTGYLNSWSSSQNYIKMTGKNPVDLIKNDLEDAWGDLAKKKQITWDIALKVGRKE